MNRREKAGPIGWAPPDLSDRVAVVAGASRGAGRGIALALAETGATVYVTARTVRTGPKRRRGAPGTIQDTADEVNARGGRGIPVRVDYTRKPDVEALFTRVRREQGRLDILANSVFSFSEQFNDQFLKKKKLRPFWEHESTGWEESMVGGAYAHLLGALNATRIMAGRRRGMIVSVSEPVVDTDPHSGPLWWLIAMIGHRAINRMAEAMCPDLKRKGIAIVALFPGFMRTEGVEKVMKKLDEATRRKWGYHKSETTEYVGRAVASLAADSRVLTKSGKLLCVSDLASEYGFKDADGKAVGNFLKEMGML